MAFPGGHKDPDDADLCAAAIRETAEEIGLDISHAPVIGTLPTQRPMSSRRKMMVAPFVFEIDGDPAFTLNHEVAEAAWTPLEPMYRGDNQDTGSPDGGQLASTASDSQAASSLGADLPHGPDTVRDA